MKIPQFEPSVSQQQGRALEVPNIPVPPPVAFGTEVAQKTEQLGSIVSGVGDKLANHMLERLHEEQSAQVIQADNGFRTDLQKNMFDTETDDHGVPKGVFNRQGYQAQGATEEFDADFKARRQAMLEAMDTPYKKQRLGELMDENYPRLRELVAKHEGTQVRLGQKSVIDGHNQLAIQNAPNYFGDSNGLIKSITTEAQMKHNNLMANGVDSEEIMSKINNLSSDMVLSSLRPSLHENPDQAQTFFDQLTADPKNPLDPSAEGKIQQIIDDAKKRFQSRSKSVLDVHFNSNEANLAGKIANDQLTLDDLDQNKTNVSDDFYKIATVALKNKGVVEGTEQQQSAKAVSLMEEFGHIAEAESDKRTAAIMKYRKDVLANSTKLAPDQFHKLLSWSDPAFVNQIKPKVSLIQAGIQFIKDHYNNYTTGKGVEGAIANFVNGASAADEKDIPGLAQNAIKPDTLKENPSLVGQPDLANNVASKTTGIKQVTNNTTTLKPQSKIVNPPIFKAGDVQEKQGVKYQRGQDGKWRPMKS